MHEARSVSSGLLLCSSNFSRSLKPEACPSATLGHVDIGLAPSVGVGHHADYGETELLVKLVRVPAQGLYVREVPEDVGVEVDAGEGRHARVVGAEAERQGAALP